MRVASVAGWVVMACAEFSACAGLSACAPLPASATRDPMHASRAIAHAGYLAPQAVPDSVAILPPPPQAGSAAQALDDAVSRQDLALRGSDRWNLARQDADIGFPSGAGIFACALQAPITPQDTPALYRLLRKSLVDAGASPGAAKRHYHRPRPFAINHQPTCTPAVGGSYPSGHSTAGWTWALILAEVAPDRATAILQRGRAYAESRLVCNVHWYSDTIAGQTLGAATVAALHRSQEFRDDVEKAEREVAQAHSRALAPHRDCQAEARALAEHSPATIREDTGATPRGAPSGARSIDPVN